MHRDDQPTSKSTGVPPERVAETGEIIDRITRWAAGRHDVVGLLLVGSCARNAARPDSDIDLVLDGIGTVRLAHGACGQFQHPTSPLSVLPCKAAKAAKKAKAPMPRT